MRLYKEKGIGIAETRKYPVTGIIPAAN